LDVVVFHHRARCTVVDIAAADTAVVDHVHPGLIVELVAAGRAHVLWVQSCVLVVAVVAAAIADDIVGFAEIAGSEEALVSEGTAYSARGRYMIVDVPMIRRIQLTHPCELRAHQMLEQLLQNDQHTLVREIVVWFRGLRSHWSQVHPGALSVFYPPNQYKNRIDYPPPVINT